MKNLKPLFVKAIMHDLENVKAGVVFNYQGLTSEEINQLRRTLEEKNLRMRVYKNSYFRIALKELNLGTKGGEEKEEKIFNNPSAVIFSPEHPDPVEAAKAIHDWIKEENKKDLEVKGGFYQEELLDSAEVKKYTTIPSREVLLAQVVGAIAAPLSSLVGVLKAPLRDFVLVLKAIQDKKGES
ncbi:MAG: 50S ribosomal protein L10 [Planctomycetota bacterium]|nr:MAG: 50S ribosomal protein L10 [Planctomycetota bacterium]